MGFDWKDTVWTGIAGGCLLHLLQILIVPIGALAGALYFHSSGGLVWSGLVLALMAWSVTQLFYLGPAMWLAYRAGHRRTGKGLVMVAVAGFLLNGAGDFLFFVWPRFS